MYHRCDVTWPIFGAMFPFYSEVGWLTTVIFFPKFQNRGCEITLHFFGDSMSRLGEIEKSLAKKSWCRWDSNHGPEDGDITKRMFFHWASWPRLSYYLLLLIVICTKKLLIGSIYLPIILSIYLSSYLAMLPKKITSHLDNLLYFIILQS